MKAKKLLALLLTGAMAAALGTFAIACNNGGGGEPGGEGGGGGTGGEGTGGGGGSTADYTLDETEYYLVGTGAGDLKQNAWSNTNHILKLVRDEEADHNVFTITISMYADDAFQIIHDDSWDGQMGISFMQGAVEEGDKTVVKDAEDNVIFYGGGMMSVDITLSKGYDAKYTFSLHTYPDGEQDPYITYEKVDDLKALSDMYVVGDFNDFGFNQKVFDKSHMTKNGDIWRYSLEVTEDDLKYDETGAAGNEYTMIGVMNNVEDDNGIKAVYTSEDYGTALHGDDEYNLVPAGIYTITYNGADNSVTIKAGANDIYFIGSMNGWNTDMGDEWKLTEDLATGIWSGYLTITEDDYAVEDEVQRDYATVKLYNKLGGASDTWLSPDGNNIELTAGEYAFTYNPETKEVKYEQCAYFIVGSFTNAQGEADDDNCNFKLNAGSSIKLNATQTANVYSADYNYPNVSAQYDWVAPGVFALKVVYGTTIAGVKPNTAWYGGGAEGNDNVLIPEAGEYTVTFNAETHAITVAPVVHEVTVTFNLNYAEAAEPEVKTINQGTTVTAPEEPERAEYTFYGWYTEENCENKFDFTKPVNANTVLYARWEKTSEIPTGKKVTFNYNDGGTTHDKDVDIDGKGLVAPEAAERDGYYFLGWYTAQSNGELVNFDELVTENKTVYAHWRKIDTHTYHMVGKLKNGKIAEWTAEDLSLTFTHSDKHPTENMFTLSVRLFAGDEFKILSETNDWNNDKFSAWAISGVDCGDGLVYAEANNDGGNIKVAISGDYVLYASTDTWKLTWTVEELANPNDMYFVLGTTETKMTADTDAWTGTITVDGTKPLKLIDKYDGNKEYPVGDGNLEAGDYFVKFNVKDSSVQYEKLEYYVVGTLVIDGQNISFSITAKSPKLEGDGTLTVDLTVTDVTTVAEYKWLKDQGKGIFAIKVGYGSVLGGVKDWLNNFDATTDITLDDNIFFQKAGNFTVSFDVTSKKITITEKTA